MSRVSVLEKMYIKEAQIDEFDYDKLSAPPLYAFLSYTDVLDLHSIATSLRYNADIDKKYKLIDEIMVMRGFRKAHAGTNRVVYNFLDYPYIVTKVAIDKVGIGDSPAEFKNQNLFKPFCTKVFEVDATGTVGLYERVNPISSLEEFVSIANEIFYLINKLVGKYVLDDIGVSKYMNYGVRNRFGPVILDFPYAYELDGKKLICNKPIQTQYGPMRCCGEIDYDAGFDNLYCTKCGRIYQARDLGVNKKNEVLFMEGEGDMVTRARIMRGNEVICDNAAVTDCYITKDQMAIRNHTKDSSLVKVDRSFFNKALSAKAAKAIEAKRADKKIRDNENVTKAVITNKIVEKKIEPVEKVADDYSAAKNPIVVPKEVKEEIVANDNKSLYDKLLSAFTDEMLEYFGLKINKRGKATKDGKFVSFHALEVMCREYEKYHAQEEDTEFEEVDDSEEYEEVEDFDETILEEY
jgi:hypothetical protein